MVGMVGCRCPSFTHESVESVTVHSPLIMSKQCVHVHTSILPLQSDVSHMRSGVFSFVPRPRPGNKGKECSITLPCWYIFP